MTSTQSIQRILVPVDYSPCSERALERALDLADQLGASVEVLHVSSVPDYGHLKVHEGPHEKTILELVEERVRQEMTDFLQNFGVRTARIDHKIVTGPPVSEILERVKGGTFDLVVMGTHGRTGLSYALLGSTAANLVRLCPCPVMVVPLGE